jgi:hypothetical protein
MFVHAKTAATIGILALVIGAAATVALRGYFSPTPAGYALRLDQAAVVKEMRELGRLETASFTIEKIIEAGTAGNAFQKFLFGDKLLLVAHGEVIAGTDLSYLEACGVRVDGSSVRVALPPTTVLVSRLDNSLTRVYDRRTGVLARSDKDLEAEARAAAEAEIVKAACASHILEEAADNAKKQVGALLSGLGFASVDIEVPVGTCGI